MMQTAKWETAASLQHLDPSITNPCTALGLKAIDQNFVN